MSVAEAPVAGHGPALSPLAWRRAWLAIDSNRQAISFVETLPGTLALHVAFIAVLTASFQISMAAVALIAVTLLAIAVFPQYRLHLITGSSIFFLAMRPYRISEWSDLTRSLAIEAPAAIHPLVLQTGAVSAFLIFAFGFLLWQRKSANLIAAKRPVLTLMTMVFGLLIGAFASSNGSYAHTFFWAFLGVFISSFWFLAYAAADQKTKDQTPLLARAGFMRPFWGGSATPIGKSYGYLNKFDAKSPQDLAITRLKALKLAVWALVLTGLWKAVEAVLYGELNVPYLQEAVLAHAAGAAPPVAMNWASVVSNYFLDLLIIAVWGHLIVATIRMVGFRIPRNTVNPLASRTLTEFWNRYFFYFKELLVDFFFYPAFLRYFKKHPKIRLAFATLCAAGLGNFLYHFMRETHVFATKSVTDALAIFPSAVFYSLVLAAGLIVSQWRARKVKPEDGFFAYHVWPRLNVMLFFCFLKIFDDISGEGTLTERAAFTLGLFGV